MTSVIKRLREVSAEQLTGMRRGIEKESLRAQLDGNLALTPHPSALGSAGIIARSVQQELARFAGFGETEIGNPDVPGHRHPYRVQQSSVIYVNKVARGIIRDEERRGVRCSADASLKER